MEGAKFIETIRLENILSFGPNSEPFPLEPLNVFIGPNASGKSNFIQALSLLHAAPRDIQEPIRRGGGIAEWLWKGAEETPIARIEACIGYPGVHEAWERDSDLLNYRLSLTEKEGEFRIVDETVEDAKPRSPQARTPYPYSCRIEGRPVVSVTTTGGGRVQRSLTREEVKDNRSVFSSAESINYEATPELWWVRAMYTAIHLYTEWRSGLGAPARLPVPVDTPQIPFVNASNLAALLKPKLEEPPAKEEILKWMTTFLPWFKDMEVVEKREAGKSVLEILVYEKKLSRPVPAIRLSDGTLRYLWLVTLLTEKVQPAIVCIEEPELGLHPDIIPDVSKLLVEASQRVQLFVTTHSDYLVDALSDLPEAVVVCDNRQGPTHMKRLDSERLQSWLEEYRLGEIWMRGAIGGTRW